jgi:hypothetical protein
VIQKNVVNGYPLVNVYITMENHHNGKINCKWPFSIGYVTNYQRVLSSYVYNVDTNTYNITNIVKLVLSSQSLYITLIMIIQSKY